MKRRSPAARLARALLILVLGAALASVAAVTALRWLPVPVTAFMVQERIASRAAGTPLHQRHAWVAWPRISRHAALAVIAAEDQNFLLHHGFDFHAIENRNLSIDIASPVQASVIVASYTCRITRRSPARFRASGKWGFRAATSRGSTCH